jgi:hypothetical protein
MDAAPSANQSIQQEEAMDTERGPQSTDDGGESGRMGWIFLWLLGVPLPLLLILYLLRGCT